MKILFLDIDGVLNSMPTVMEYGLDFIDDILVALVARIVNETDCKIVLSSTWRIEERNFELVKKALANRGLEVHDKTPVLERAGDWVRRHEEIQAWLDQNQVDKFAIVDDFEDAEIQGNFFKTHEDRGLTVQIAEQIIQHLNA